MKQPQHFNLRDLLQADYVFITQDGLSEFERIIESREDNYYRNRKVSRPEHIEAQRLKKQNRFERDIILPIVHSESIEGHNDELPLLIQSVTLKQYIDDLRTI